MTETFFVDSNVLVYRRDASERVKQPLASAWVDALWAARAGRVSVQVLEEFYQVVTRKLRPGLPRTEARSEIREFFAWRPIPLSAEVLEEGWSVEDRHRLSFWDSLIVGAARVAGCRYLLSEDLQDGQDLGAVTIVDPFRHSPNELGLG